MTDAGFASADLAMASRNIPVTFANLVKAKLILAGRLVLAIQEFGQLTIAHAGGACTKFFFFFGFLDMNFFDKSH